VLIAASLFMQRHHRRAPIVCKRWWMMNAAARVVTLGNTIVGWRQFYTTSSIGWTFPRGLNASSVWWCTGVCTDKHLATSLITSSQPLMLLLAAAVYFLPTGTVSLCLAVDSARIAVGKFDYAGPTVWNSLPDELRNSVLIVLNGSSKQLS